MAKRHFAILEIGDIFNTVYLLNIFGYYNPQA